MDIGWEHPLDASEGWEGLNDGDMEHFVKDPIVKTAREGIQNSLDAKNPKNKGIIESVHLTLCHSIINSIRKNGKPLFKYE